NNAGGSIEIHTGSSFTITGDLSNSGTISARSTTTPASLIDVQGRVHNDGKLEALGDGTVHLESAVKNMAGGLILADLSGASVTMDGNVINQAGGTIEAGQDAKVEIKGALLNAGDLVADNGTLQVDGAVTGQGHAMITDAGVVDLEAAANTHVAFSGADAG